jgi:hypothetical protein
MVVKSSKSCQSAADRNDLTQVLLKVLAEMTVSANQSLRNGFKTNLTQEKINVKHGSVAF